MQLTVGSEKPVERWVLNTGEFKKRRVGGVFMSRLEVRMSLSSCKHAR